MGGWKRIEREELLPIFLQTRCRLRILRFIGLPKHVEGPFRRGSGVRLPDVM